MKKHTKTFLIIGGSGPLGSNLVNCLLKRELSCHIYSTYNSRPPVTNSNQVSNIKADFSKPADIDSTIDLILRLSKESEVVIFFLASVSKPDRVEENEKDSRLINVRLPEVFLQRLGESKNIKFFFSSTDMVYGNSSDGSYFSEGSDKSAINLYAKQKSEAEDVVLNYGSNVLRHTFMFGPSMAKHEGFYEIIYKSLSNGKAIDMFYDSYRNFIDFQTTSELMIDLSLGGLESEIINICSDDHLSKYDLGMLVARKFNFSESLLKKISFHDGIGKAIYKTSRPCSTLMSNKKLKGILGIRSVSINV